jgi:hypothetical protein
MGERDELRDGDDLGGLALQGLELLIGDETLSHYGGTSYLG